MGSAQCSCQRRPADDGCIAACDADSVLDGDEPVHSSPTLSASDGHGEQNKALDEVSTAAPSGDSEEAEASDAEEEMCVDDECELAELVENTKLDRIGKECAFTHDDNIVGDHICQRVQDDAFIQTFSAADVTSKLLKLVEDRVVQDHAEGANRQELLDSLRGMKGSASLAYCVSDPSVPDCPMAFVSAGFENATGYSAEFATGRSCRFLQPTSTAINDALNLHDRVLMRHFCKEPLPEGTSLVSFLLNEHYDGRRFWNLLKMEHVYVDGKCYIFAVQSVVNSYMPKMLRKRVQDKAVDKQIIDGLKKFLKQLKRLRCDIESSKDSISSLNKHVKASLKDIKVKSDKAKGG